MSYKISNLVASQIILHEWKPGRFMPTEKITQAPLFSHLSNTSCCCRKGRFASRKARMHVAATSSCSHYAHAAEQILPLQPSPSLSNSQTHNSHLNKFLQPFFFSYARTVSVIWTPYNSITLLLVVLLQALVRKNGQPNKKPKTPNTKPGYDSMTISAVHAMHDHMGAQHRSLDALASLTRILTSESKHKWVVWKWMNSGCTKVCSDNSMDSTSRYLKISLSGQQTAVWLATCQQTEYEFLFQLISSSSSSCDTCSEDTRRDFDAHSSSSDTHGLPWYVHTCHLHEHKLLGGGVCFEAPLMIAASSGDRHGRHISHNHQGAGPSPQLSNLVVPATSCLKGHLLNWRLL